MSNLKLNILAEGQTEEAFVRDYLSAYIAQINPRLTVGYQVLYGVGGMNKIRNHLCHWHKSEPDAVYTTMIDFYEFPADIRDHKRIMSMKNLYDKVEAMEGSMLQEVMAAEPTMRFIPYIQLHEFEAILYTDLDQFEMFYEPWRVNRLRKEVKGFPTPEHINCGLRTAPSKRILRNIHDYSKRTAGPKIAGAIGIDAIRRACRHFDGWLSLIERIGHESLSS